MRISDWSSDVCSSDLYRTLQPEIDRISQDLDGRAARGNSSRAVSGRVAPARRRRANAAWLGSAAGTLSPHDFRSEEHTSELQSLMRISYAVFCLKKKNKNNHLQLDRIITTTYN